MYKTISNAIIRQFKPCYDPSELITDENEELPIKDWVQKYRDVVPAQDIFWLLCRKKFLSEKDLRLFAVWCVREALKLVKDPDIRSVEACNVAEKFANGEATREELNIAYDAASDAIAARDTVSRADALAAAVADAVADAAAYAADDYVYSDSSAANAATASAAAYYIYVSDVSDDIAYAAFCTSQINKLLTYFE